MTVHETIQGIVSQMLANNGTAKIRGDKKLAANLRKAIRRRGYRWRVNVVGGELIVTMKKPKA